MRANISLAQRELGYKPMADLQTGLKKFFGFCSGGKMAARWHIHSMLLQGPLNYVHWHLMIIFLTFLCLLHSYCLFVYLNDAKYCKHHTHPSNKIRTFFSSLECNCCSFTLVGFTPGRGYANWRTCIIIVMQFFFFSFFFLNHDNLVFLFCH